MNKITQLFDSKYPIIQGGMIPKVTSCVEALNGGGVKKTHIVDARLPHALLLEFFTDQGVGTQIIKAVVPMSEMLSYGNDLTSMTQGRATFHMEFDHYDVVLTSEAAP